MRILSFLVVVTIVGLISCGTEERKIEEIPSTPLTFEEQVRSHTQHYCDCAKPLNDYSNTLNPETMDSVQITEYEMKKAEFLQCFDPQGVLKLFRDTLSQEMKQKQMQLFDKYRQEICPEIIPNR